MHIDIGAKIRQLRLEHSMTQEQLAQKLDVTAQAVSKWETGTTMPDIQLLPDLSVVFGISIDALFSMTDECRMERIENMLSDIRFLSAQDFEQSESFLKDRQAKEDTKARATLLLAELYNKRASEYHALAAPLAREALLLCPGSKDAHNAVFDAEGGAYQDWNFINHRALIDFYKEVVAAHPNDRCNYYWLLDLLIADCRTTEAREYAQRMKAAADTYHYELYMGNICRAEGNLPQALDWWHSMTGRAPDSWIVWAEYASCMAKLARYDDAIHYYKKAMPMRPVPRFIDCEEAAAQIYEIQGKFDDAITMQKQALQIIKEDWAAEGELVDSRLREISRLQSARHRNRNA